MFEFALATTSVSLIILAVALIGRYVELRREAQEEEQAAKTDG